MTMTCRSAVKEGNQPAAASWRRAKGGFISAKAKRARGWRQVGRSIALAELGLIVGIIVFRPDVLEQLSILRSVPLPAEPTQSRVTAILEDPAFEAASMVFVIALIASSVALAISGLAWLIAGLGKHRSPNPAVQELPVWW